MNQDINSTYSKIIVWMTHTSFICFTTGFGIAIYDNLSQKLSLVVLADSLVVLTLSLFYILYLRKVVSKKKAMIVLAYAVMANVIASGFLFIDAPNFEANVSYSVNVVFIILFVIPFTTSISRAFVFNVITLVFFLVLAFFSGDKISQGKLIGILFLLHGIGFTCIFFSKLITRFIRSSIDSQSKIQELSYFKQKITRLIIHDLKVPASTILNLSDYKDDRAMREINKQVRKINKQLEDVLDVERLEEPDFILEFNEIEIDKLVLRALDAVESIALKKNIVLNSSFRASGYLKCDINLIERTLINLLSNAIKYSPTNERIELSLRAEKGNCFIVIEDNGVGIPPEQLTKIFDKFYRIKTEKSSGSSSNGLGLSFCKLAINAHKGSIKAISGNEYGEGSKFEIRLPNFIESNSKDYHTEKHTQTIQFSVQEKEQISIVCNQIHSIPIYKVSEIMRLTSSLQSSQSESIILWFEKFSEAVYTGNQLFLSEIITPFVHKEYELEND